MHPNFLRYLFSALPQLTLQVNPVYSASSEFCTLLMQSIYCITEFFCPFAGDCALNMSSLRYYGTERYFAIAVFLTLNVKPD